MERRAMAAIPGNGATRFGTFGHDEVVEIALLLPAQRAEALVDLSRRRRQTVGQILPLMIDRALAAEDCPRPGRPGAFVHKDWLPAGVDPGDNGGLGRTKPPE